MKSFLCALRGLAAVLGEERHMRIHLCFAFYVVLAGLVTGLAPAEWGLILGCCGLVMGLECINSALERLCNRVCAERDGLIGKAKDMAAGAVLISALFSAAAGLCVFLSDGRPHAALEFFTERPMLCIALILSLCLWILIIFGRRKK